MEKPPYYNGLYIPRDGFSTGHLLVDDEKSSLMLLNQKGWQETGEEFSDHHGILQDGVKASLIDCIVKEKQQYRWGDEVQYKTTLFPHIIFLGEQFVTSTDKIIKSIHYHFENIDCLVHDPRMFGMIDADPSEVMKLLEADHNRLQQIAEEHKWGSRPFDARLGDRPVLLFYNGISEIISCEVEEFSLSLRNRVQYGPGSSKGVGIENQITLVIEFEQPQLINDAMEVLFKTHKFFELCLGRRQRVKWIEVSMNSRKEREPFSRVYWSLCNDGIIGETRSTHYCDVLIDPVRRGDEFSTVVSNWLGTNDSKGEARTRFFSAFQSGSYGIDRIVGAANMFDLLPSNLAPKKVELDMETENAVDECRTRFKALPESFIRQSMLSALGRVGTASLRHKVIHRANIVIEKSDDEFSGIELPCSEAVLCRNHYVHGSDASFDYSDNFTSFVFMTDTLEFIFSVSDLIELGWDYKEWRRNGTVLSHRFGAYKANFDENMVRLKALLGK